MSTWLMLACLAAAPTDASPGIAVQPGERAALVALGQLTSPELESARAGLAAAAASGSVFYDAPLRTLLASERPAALRAEAAATLARLEWPAKVADLNARIEALGRAAELAEPAIRHAALLGLGRYPTPDAQRILRQRRGAGNAEDVAVIDRAFAAMRAPGAVAALTAWLAVSAGGESAPAVPAKWRLAAAARDLVIDPESRAMDDALEVLLAAGDLALVRPLVAHAARFGKASVRERAFAHLEAQPLPIDTDFLIAALQDPRADVRAAALRAIAKHRSATVAEAVADAMLAETSDELVRQAAEVLRAQETATLARALTARLRMAKGYARQLLILLARERSGREMVWAKTLAYAADPSSAGLEVLVAEPIEDRRAVLLPLLASQPAERVAILRGLRGTEGAAVRAAVLPLVAADADAEVIRAAGDALASQPDDVVVPHLERVLGAADPTRRAALYDLLLARNAHRVLAGAVRDESDAELAASLIERVDVSDAAVRAAVVGRLEADQPAPVLRATLGALQNIDEPELAPRYGRLVRQRAEHADQALSNLANLSDPGATEELRAVVGDPGAGGDLKLAAMFRLSTRGGPEDVPRFEAMLDDDDSQVRAAARSALHELDPEQYPEWDQLGRSPLVLSTAGLGTTLLLLSTTIAEQATATEVKDISKVLVGVTGAALGGGTAFLLTLDTDVSLGEAGYVTTLGAWSTLGGYSLARVAGWSADEPTAPLWGAMGGELLGLGLGALTMRSARFTSGDAVLTNVVATSAGTAALSAWHLGRVDSNTANGGDAFVLGALAGTVPMVFFSPRLDLDADTVLGVTASLAFTSWVGAFAPRALFRPGDRRSHDVIAGVGLGQAIGLAGGLALSQVTDFDGETVAWATLGGLAGASFGAGIAMSEDILGDRWTYRLLELGTLAGAGTFAWLGPKTEISDTDLGLITLMMAGGALVGARIPELVAASSDATQLDAKASAEERWGGALLGASAGLFAGLASSQLVDLSGGELAMTAGGATVLGTGGAGLVLLVPEFGRENFSPAFSAGATIGAVGLGAFLAPRLRYEPADLSLGLSSLALGSFLGAWLPAYQVGEGEPLPDSRQIGGAMLGGALGLLFAGTVSQFTDVEPRRVLRVDLGAVGGMAGGAGLGMLLPHSLTPSYDRRLTVGLMQAGAVAGYAIATVTERKTDYTWADRFHMGLGMALGAGHGAMIPYLWRDPDDPAERDVPDQEITGGALLGGGLGTGLARLSVKLDPKDGADVFEVALFDLLATGVGVGLAGGIEDLDRRGRYALLDSVGLAGFFAGELLASHTEFSLVDRWTVGTLTVAGAVGGAALPYWILDYKPELADIGGGATFGAAALGLAGLGLAQVTEWQGDDQVEWLLAASVAAAGGWGVAQAHLGTSLRRRLRGAGLGWFSGLGFGLALAPSTEFSDNDRWWLASGTLVGAWIGGLVPRLLHGEAARADNLAGGAVAGAAFGTLAAGGLVQLFEAPADWAWGATSVSLATTLVAGGLARMGVPEDPSQDALSMQLAAVGGFALAGLIAPRARLEPADYGTIGTFAVLGAWHGGWARDAFEVEADNARDGGALAGAGAGMLVGYGLAQALDLDWGDNLEMAGMTALGSGIGSGLGLMLQEDTTGITRALELGSLAGLGVGLGVARLTEYREGSTRLIGLAGAWGAWHGLWLGEAFADEQERDEGLAGSALFGASLGLATGMALSQWMQPDTSVLTEASVLMGAGNSLGAGIGKLAGASNEVQTALLTAGGVAGLATGLAVADRTAYERLDPNLVTMTGVIGAGHGAMLGAMLDLESESVWGGLLLGAGVGTAGGMALAQTHDFAAGDLVEIALALAAGDAVGAGLGQWLDLEYDAHLGLVQAGGLALLTASLLTAELTDFDSSDRTLALFGTAYGSWLGGWAPLIWHDDNDEVSTDAGVGMVLGAGAGLILGAAASQLVDYRTRDIGEIAFGTTMTGTLGAGLGLLARPDSDLWVGLMEAGSLAGTLVIAAVAKRTEHSSSDALLGGLAALYGVYQGAGLSLLVDAGDQQVAGAMMTAGAIGALGGSYLGPYLELDANDIWMLLAGSAWGVWIGVWTAAALGRQDQGKQDNPFFLGVGTTALATDVTLVATSIAISKLVEMPPKQFAWISVAGGLGLVGGLMSSYLAGETMSPQLGIAVGSAGGLVAGAVVTSFFEWEQPVYSRAPAVGKSGHGLSALPEVAWWFPSVNVMPLGDVEGLSPDRGTAVLFSVTGALR